MSSVESREIRGISVKLLTGIIAQTIVMVATACTFYFTLKGDIRNLQTLREEGQKIWQLKFDQIQIQNSIFQKQLDEITVRLDRLRIEVKN